MIAVDDSRIVQRLKHNGQGALNPAGGLAQRRPVLLVHSLWCDGLCAERVAEIACPDERLRSVNPVNLVFSNFGLLTDLKRCPGPYAAGGFITPLARWVSVLEKATAGFAEILTLTGLPGIGQTGWMEDLRAAVGEAGTYCGSGMCDPYRSTFHAGLIEAFRVVIQKISGESPEGSGYRTDCFRRGIGRHLQAIIGFLPQASVLPVKRVRKPEFSLDAGSSPARYRLASSAAGLWDAQAKSRLIAPNPPPAPSPPASRPIDYAAVVRALQGVSTEIVLDQLLIRLVKIVVDNTGARKVLFVLRQGDHLEIKASGGVDGPARITNQTVQSRNRDDLLLSALRHVQHTLQSLVIDDAQASAEHRGDPYVIHHKLKAILCLPIVRHDDLVAILYLENNIAAGVFTPDRIEILQLIASQAAISIENARLYESMRQKERDLIELSERMRKLSSELVLTEERQRRRIAVDLHDRIGHALANVRMQLGMLERTVSGKESRITLSRISGLIDQSIKDTQSLTFDLSPPILYDLGLGAALEWLVDQMREQYRITMVFKEDPAPKPMDESLRVLAFRAVRELLFNIIKHARAHHAWVTLKRLNEQIHIEIEDDGIGLNASRKETHARMGGGFGLFSIQERLKHCGGHLEMASEPGKGTRITLIAPIEPTGKDRSCVSGS